MVDVEDLETVNGKAGKSLNGHLLQNFVALNKRDQAQLQSVSRSVLAPNPSTSRNWSVGARGVSRGSFTQEWDRSQKSPGMALELETVVIQIERWLSSIQHDCQSIKACCLLIDRVTHENVFLQ